MAGLGSPASAWRLGAVGASGSVLLLLLSQEIPAGSIDPAAIDLAPLVNTLINSTQSGPLQLFSLLSVTSYSSLELHKLTLLIYNISSVSVESKMFHRRFCYCVSNKTNDLTDFTAILLDVMSNSSYLHEIFKSTSILSVSQKNDTDCIYICVMAGQADRELPQLWDSDLITPLFNQTIIEDPHRSGNLSLHHSSIAWQQMAPADGQTPSREQGQGLVTSVSSDQLSGQTPPSPPPPSPSPSPEDAATPPPRDPLTPTPSPPSLRTTVAAVTHRLTSRTVAATRPAETPTDPRTPVSITTTATTPTSQQRGMTTGAARPPPATARPPPATAVPITTERPPVAPPLPAVMSSQTALTSPPAVRPGQLTTARKTTTASEQEPTNSQHASTTQHQVHSGGAGAPQGAMPPAAPTVLVQQEVTSSPWRTSVVDLLLVGGPVDSAIAPTISSEKPGCPWRRASDALSGVPGGPEGPWPTLGAHKLQPCLLELCKFFSQCLCRPDQPRSPQRRYCDDSDLWYRKHTSELCGRLKRIAFSRNLKQRCLAKMCGRP